MTSPTRDIAADTLSLRTEPWPDTLRHAGGWPGTPDLAGGLRDTLPTGADTSVYAGPEPFDTISVSPFREAQAAEVFGAESFVPTSAVQSLPEAVSLTDNLPMQIATLCLLLLYSYIIFRYGREIAQLFRMVFAARREERAKDDYSYMSADFISGLLTAGYLMAGIAAVKAIELPADGAVLAAAGRQGPLLVMAAVSLSLAAIHIIQRLAMRVTGAVTLSTGFIRRLLSLRRLFFVAATVSAAPAVLLFALAEGESAQILGCAAAVTAAVFLIYYIYRSLRLFVEEKVSILLWMLYLCTVEVMPPAMILLSALSSI
jgi:hypothetical protein